MQLETTFESLSTSFGPDGFSSSSSGNSSYQGYNSSSNGYNTMSGASIVTTSTGAGRMPTSPEGSDTSSGYLNDYADFEASIPTNDDLDRSNTDSTSKPVKPRPTSEKRRTGGSRRGDASTPSPPTQPQPQGSRKHHRKRTGTEKQRSSQRSHAKQNSQILPEPGTSHSSVAVDLSTSPTLPHVDRVPWSDQDILNAIRQGRAASVLHQQWVSSDVAGAVPALTPPLEVIQRLGHLLQYPLVRIAREAKRLSLTLNRCGRHEIQHAMKIVLSCRGYNEAVLAGHQAATLYASGDDEPFRRSKSDRAGLSLPVGRCQRWLLDAGVAGYVHETSAIYAAACLQSILDDVILASFHNVHDDDHKWTVEGLEKGIAMNSDLWGLLQPFDHLNAGRTARGSLVLPSNYESSSGPTECATSGSSKKSLEQSLLTTSCSSLIELDELLSTCMAEWYNNCNHFPTSSHTSSSRSQSPVNKAGPPLPPLKSGHSSTFTWSRAASQNLLYFLLDSSSDCQRLYSNLTVPSIDLDNKKSSAFSPPLYEWIRVSAAFAEYRKCVIIDADDVTQAARILLPNTDCPPRKYLNSYSSQHSSPDSNLAPCTKQIYHRMIENNESEAMAEFMKIFGSKKSINQFNEQGLTPLMYACIRGDEQMVKCLISEGALIDQHVPVDIQQHPSIHPDTKYWTPLNFAVIHGHYSIAKLLLDHQASIEGSVKRGEVNHAETPLQLAAATGHYELVSLLLLRGADPYLTTIHKNSYVTGHGGTYSAFALAASHGHSLSSRNVLRKLLSHPVKKNQEMLSLEEILAETSAQSREESQKHHVNKLHQYAEQRHLEKESDLEHDYATIDDIIFDDQQFRATVWPEDTLDSMTQGQFRCLQEAMYHAAENGYLDVTLELRNLGVPWTLHTWSQSFCAAVGMRRRTIVQCLLKDWGSCITRGEMTNQEFIYNTLPLMFHQFQKNKDASSTKLLANVFTQLYGQEIIPGIPQPDPVPITNQLDGSFINNPDRSDIQFIVEGQRFYSHQLVLAQASQRFRQLLSNHTYPDDMGNNCIELTDVRYRILELTMQFLYNGAINYSNIDSMDIVQLLSAAVFFQLDGLQRCCEGVLASRLNSENCVTTYKNAKLYDCLALQSQCESYFLQNLPTLITANSSFERLAFSVKSNNYELVQGLLVTLTEQLLNNIAKARLRKISKNTKPPLPKDRNGVTIHKLSRISYPQGELLGHVTRDSLQMQRHSYHVPRESPVLHRHSSSPECYAPSVSGNSVFQNRPIIQYDLSLAPRDSMGIPSSDSSMITRDYNGFSKDSGILCSDSSFLARDYKGFGKDSGILSCDSSMVTRDYKSFVLSGSKEGHDEGLPHNSFDEFKNKPFISMSSQV